VDYKDLIFGREDDKVRLTSSVQYIVGFDKQTISDTTHMVLFQTADQMSD
jgi:hypothetical protein